MATKEVRYLSAEGCETDDFNVRFSMKAGEFVYDAKTFLGPWATMSEESFKKYGLGELGTGRGQKYMRTESGTLIKVEG